MTRRSKYLKKVAALLDQAYADAERTARFRTEVEQAVNSYVQNDRRVPADVIARRRQAIADVEASQPAAARGQRQLQPRQCHSGDRLSDAG